MPTNYDELFLSLNYDDYEEATLLTQIKKIEQTEDQVALMPPAMRPKPNAASKYAAELKAALIAKLGYNPAEGRKSRPRGRAKATSYPQPLPEPGTELRSCLGDEYIVQGYAWAPTRISDLPTYVIYQHDGNLLVRSLANMFAGTLASGEPIVTWPTDSRGLKPGQVVPIMFRRHKTREQLKADRDAMDEDLKQYEASKGRRY